MRPFVVGDINTISSIEKILIGTYRSRYLRVRIISYYIFVFGKREIVSFIKQQNNG